LKITNFFAIEIVKDISFDRQYMAPRLIKVHLVSLEYLLLEVMVNLDID
jgi:hypothetical protein